MEHGGISRSIHNQYLTFVVGGGVLALIGLIFIVIGFIKLIRSISYFKEDQFKFYFKFVFALIFSCMTFFITLLTIEMTGLCFFYMLSFLLFVEKEMLDYTYEIKYNMISITQ